MLVKVTMEMHDQTETFLEHLRENIVKFSEKEAEARIDRLLSTLQLIGIKDTIPKEKADYALANLEDIENL